MSYISYLLPMLHTPILAYLALGDRSVMLSPEPAPLLDHLRAPHTDCLTERDEVGQLAACPWRADELVRILATVPDNFSELPIG